MLWGTMASASPDLPETLRPLAESNARLGMPNLLEKLKAGEPVKIAYLGGSITEQNGWRVLSRKFIQRKFPNAKVEEINAAIDGTYCRQFTFQGISIEVVVSKEQGSFFKRLAHMFNRG